MNWQTKGLFPFWYTLGAMEVRDCQKIALKKDYGLEFCGGTYKRLDRKNQE